MAYSATFGLMCCCRAARLSGNDEDGEDDADGTVVVGTRDSFSMPTRRPNVVVEESNELNSS